MERFQSSALSLRWRFRLVAGRHSQEPTFAGARFWPRAARKRPGRS